MTKETPKYCRKCGNALAPGLAYADEVKVLHYAGMDISTYRLDSPFDDSTGERNVAKILTCPLFKKSWFGSSHDKIVIYKDEFHWL